MAEDLEITGATAGSPRYIVAYLDVNTNNLYDANGNLYGNNTLTSFLDNEFTLELHYVQDISTSTNPEEWVVWDGLKDLTVSSTLAFDDNYLHAVRGTIVADASAGDESISVDVTDEINKDTLSRYGVLLVNPFGDEEDQLMIPYSSFQQISGTTFSFIVDDAQGLEASVAKDTPVRVSDPLYMFINVNDIYEANIPNRYEEGVFKFPVNVMSRKLLNALDYSGSTGVSGTMEHKIYVNKTVISKIGVAGNLDNICVRYQDSDKVASLQEPVGFKVTGSTNVYKHLEKNDIEQEGVMYYAWGLDSPAYLTKTLDITTSTVLYDEMYYTQLETTISEVVYTQNPYLFCSWIDEGDTDVTSPTPVCYTKGNDIHEGETIYTITGGTANAISGSTAYPMYSLEQVLFRTFAFPFIVRNLVDYSVSLTIPVEDIDWTKEYVISIIRNNMEEVTGKASKGAYGVVRIGENIDVTEDISGNTNGIISVKTASTSDKGVVQLVDSTSDTTSTDKAVTPNYVKTIADTKQDNLTFDTTTGIEVISGTTVKNDIATVEEVLTGATGTNIVDADNLRGALSVGQAVDVSCAPACQGVVYNYSTDGTNWVSLNDFKATNGFLSDFYVRLVNGTAGSGAAYFGFHPSLTGGKFPKAAPGLKYLVVCDVCNMGAAIYNPAGFVVNGSSIISYSRVPEDARRAEQTTYTRVAGIMTDNGRAYFAFAPDAANTTIILHIKNWRQYEVTNLTDEAIQYLASATTNPNPDDLFRSNTIDTVKNKYLIKNDVVCPWIKTINMPDNSAGLTVCAGLSYQIKYTKTGTYSVSVDTIPADAYGWDAHISMFVKDTAVVQFQAPLILMDALTPNAGHNLSVKFRNGNALVYVDDTNAGTVVYLATGTTTTKGSLPYALSQTPPSEDATFTNFVVFSPVLGGTVCSMGNMSNVAYSASLIGNGDDSTIVGGTIGLASGKYLAVQDINLNDIDITSGTLNIGNNVKVTGTTTNGVVGSGTGVINLDETCLLDFSDQTNNVPIIGASISAVSGARAIPYGETESEAISVGTGNAVNKYGKCGYLVSDASGTTASNTLYDALVGGGTPYSNVVFDPALDGSTVFGTFSTATYYMPSGRDIYGNGQGNTILTFEPSSPRNYFRADKPIKFFDITIDVVTRLFPGTYINCKFTNTRDIYPTDIGALCIGTNSAQTTTITDCIVSDILDNLNNNRCLFVINANSKLEATNVRITGCTVYKGIVLTGTTAYFGDSVLDHIVFDGNLFGSGIGGAVCASYGSSTWGVFKATIKDCSFLDTTAAIRVGGAESVVTFAGTNVINSDVSGAGTVAFADGATVTSVIPSGSTIGTGVIGVKPENPITSKKVTIENVRISGATSAGTLFRPNGTTVLTLKNCEITGCTTSNVGGSNMGFAVQDYSSNDKIILDGVNIHDNSGSYPNNVYVRDGLFYISGCTINRLEFLYATAVLSGTNKTHLQYASDGATTKLIFAPDSITVDPATSIYSIVTRGTGMMYVGIYDEATGTITTEGTATVILSGNTITISGSGTVIDSTGLHS